MIHGGFDKICYWEYNPVIISKEEDIMKKLLSVLLVMVLSFTFLTPQPASAAVKISKTKATMEVDSTLKLSLSGIKTTPTWKTSKKAVATVDKTGLVTAESEGTAKITATAGGIKYSCSVKVVDSNKVTALKDYYEIGDTWTVDGLWTLTFNSVTSTDERNEYSDKSPDQVVVLDYSYSNIGYQGDIMDLYISDMDMKIVDGSGEVADSYPGDLDNYPQETPVGATCSNAKVYIGLSNESDMITVYVEMYDNDYNEHKATFKLKVSN
jgi:hypothetical protein